MEKPYDAEADTIGSGEQAELSLIHSPAESAAILEITDDAVLSIDDRERIVRCNRAAERMFGYARAEVALQPLDLLLPGRSKHAHHRHVRAFAEGPEQSRRMSERQEVWARRKDGSEFPADIAILKSGRGGDVLLTAIVRDMSERREQRDKASIRGRALSSLLENNPLAIVFVDNQDRVVFCNSAFEQLFLYPLSEAAGKELNDLVARHDSRAASELSARTRAGQPIYEEATRQRKDGALVDVEIYGIPIVHGGQREGIYGIYHDVSSRKRAEEALLRSQALHEKAEEIAGLGHWEWNIPTNTVTVSPGLRRILGFPSRSRQMPFDEAFANLHPEDRSLISSAIDEALRDGVTPSVEHRVMHTDGSPRVLHSQGEVSFDDRGKPVRMVVTARDITERKRLEEQLRQSQRIEAVGQLAGGIAHDFNNLLTAITGFAELSMVKLDDDHPAYRDLEQVHKAGLRAGVLTRQLLAFSRQQVLDPTAMDLNACVQDMQDLLRRLIREDITLATDLSSAVGRVSADRGQIEQVILNLIINASDAMPDGGHLTVATSTAVVESATTGAVDVIEPGTYVVLCVTDTGVGMDAKTRAEIFEPFFTTKETGKGTGLGLATVYGIVRQSDGYIAVDTEPGKGTAFRVYLPRVDAVPEKAADAAPETASPRGSETILLVEDEDLVRRLACRILRDNGYNVLEAGDPQDALSIAQQHDGSIDLVLSDVIMPGLKGPELAARISSLRPEAKILLMTGYSDELDTFGQVLGARVSLLQKPFTAAELGRRVRLTLDTA